MSKFIPRLNCDLITSSVFILFLIWVYSMKIYRKTRKKIVLLLLSLSALYWISGAKEKSIVSGSWSGDTPTVLISSANLENPHSLQYDVRSNR